MCIVTFQHGKYLTQARAERSTKRAIGNLPNTPANGRTSPNRAPHEIEAMQKKRDEEAAKRKLIEGAARAEAKAKAIAAATETEERNIVPFEASGQATRNSAMESDAVPRSTATGDFDSHGATASTQGATATGSSMQSKATASGGDNLTGGSDGGGFSTLGGGTVPTLSSSITSATEDLPVKLVASG